MNKTCSCGGNNSLHSSIGGIRCECRGMLNQNQVSHRVASRLAELDDEIFSLIGALQRLGADKCDQCRMWDKDCWALYDHCVCKSCLEGNPEGPLQDEELEEKEYDEMKVSIVRFLTSRGLKVRSKELAETYRRISA